MSRWKTLLVGASLALAFIATGASGSLSGAVDEIDAFAGVVQPPVCAEGVALGDVDTANWDNCHCWFFHMGMWHCYPC